MKKRKSSMNSRAIFALIFTLCLAWLARPAEAQNATIVQIQSLGGSFMEATAMNGAGQVAGYSITTGNTAQHAFLFSAGTTLDLSTLGGQNSLANAINGSGQLV